MTSDGVNSYTWDRANRLLTWDNGVAADLVNHAYDGEGRRVSRAVGTTSPTITKYLLDIQPGLAVVLSQTEGSDVTRFVHAPRGIHARQDNDNLWHWTVQDGLGTVRMETDNSVVMEGSQNLDPYGNLIDLVNGEVGTPYGFTGELVDGSGLLDLRARRYNAGLGVFASLDPLELTNRYTYVSGNPINRVDPLGLQDQGDSVTEWLQSLNDVITNWLKSTSDNMTNTLNDADKSLTGSPVSSGSSGGSRGFGGSSDSNGSVITGEAAPLFPFRPPNIIIDTPPSITRPPSGGSWISWALLLCHILNNGACSLELGKGGLLKPGNNPDGKPDTPDKNDTGCPFPKHPSVVRRTVSSDVDVQNLASGIQSRYPGIQMCINQEYRLNNIPKGETDIELSNIVI